MRIFLTSKHWQLAGLLLGVPMAMQFIMISAIIAKNDPSIMISATPLMTLLFMGLFFGWFYTLGTQLYKKLPSSATMNLTKFKTFLLIPVAYLLFITVFMAIQFSEISVQGEPGIGSFALIIPLHLFSMFCIFYCLYFIAKAFKAVEWQKPVTFSDCAGEFFLIWFFPIGIWIIQPRINKIFDDSIQKNESIDYTI